MCVCELADVNARKRRRLFVNASSLLCVLRCFTVELTADIDRASRSLHSVLAAVCACAMEYKRNSACSRWREIRETLPNNIIFNLTCK